MDNIAQSLDYMKSIAGDFQPEVALVLGSGLASIADRIEGQTVIPYASIPGFPVPTAIGHKGNLILGEIAGHKVCAFQGRIHYYEHCDMAQVIAPVRLAGLLGAKYLFVTNASGAVNANFRLGDLMIINDHINLLPNPLAGEDAARYGDIFTDMARPYDPSLIMMAEQIAVRQRIRVQSGVYVGVTGPSYETAAENRFFRIIGADAVGMSSTPEVIAARQMNIKVFGITVITGQARDVAPGASTNGEDVLLVADQACRKVAVLIEEMIKKL